MLKDHENIVVSHQELLSETLEEEVQRRCTAIDQVVYTYIRNMIVPQFVCKIKISSTSLLHAGVNFVLDITASCLRPTGSLFVV